MTSRIIRYLKANWHRTLVAVVWLALLASGFVWANMQDMSIRDILAAVYGYVVANPLAPVIYILLYALRSVTLFPAMWLTVAAGSLFGFFPGIIWGLIGENVSANVAYAMARFLRHKNPDESEEARKLGLFRRLLAQQAFPTVLILRASFLPFDLVNYGCGLLRVSWPRYTLASMIGMLPPMFTFVSFGSAINFRQMLTDPNFSPTDLIDLQQLLISVGLVLCSIVIVIWAQRHQRVMVWRAKQKQDHASDTNDDSNSNTDSN